MSDLPDHRLDATGKNWAPEANLGFLDHQHLYRDIQNGVPEVKRQPVIVLDPGHSGHDIKSKDKSTGLNDHD